ncbi:MAG TPA: protein kinase [Polyangiaceae bacterium]|nr:protein kinase [Polyangiaceae bacterium]
MYAPVLEILDTLPAVSGHHAVSSETATTVDSGLGATPALSQATPSDWVGTTLDHFRIERPLARGGMGAVFRARDVSLDRTVAIKLLLDELSDSVELHERFAREARAQAKLNSPHVVQIYYVGRTLGPQGKPVSFLAMEYVEGGTLEEYLVRRERVAPEQARQLMLQVTRGLSDAEREGIIHRDIKPGNLLIDRNGTVKIADFGVAKVLREADTSITVEGAVIGSPLYMAPEQALAENLDQRADMYALGATFYHLLTGRPPFQGNSTVAVISQRLTTDPVAMHELAPNVPKKLADVITRLMHKDPAGRYESYRELTDALVAAMPASEQRAGFWVRAAAVAIDVVIAGGAVALFGWVGLLLHLVYVTLAQGLTGQTLGKYLFNLQVRRSDGGKLGLLRSMARTLSSMWLPFLIGFIILLSEGRSALKATLERMQPSELDALQALLTAIVIGNALLTLLYVAGLVLAAFHPQKRAAHDLIVGTEVVYRLPNR